MSAIRQITNPDPGILVGMFVVDSKSQISGRIINTLERGEALVEGVDDLRVLCSFASARLYRNEKDWQRADTDARQRWADVPPSLGDQPMPPVPTPRSRPRLVTPIGGDVR